MRTPEADSSTDRGPPGNRGTTPGRAALRAQLQLHWGAVMAVLVAQIGDLERAEQALQTALDAALSQWPAGGPPTAPRRWLLGAARRAAVDRYRRELRQQQKREQIMRLCDTRPVRAELPERRLSLMLICTHPVLSVRVALSLLLRCVCGMDQARVAQALMVSELALAHQLRRAHRSLRAQRGALGAPGAAQWPVRRERLLAVLYQLYRRGFDAAPAEAGGFGAELCQRAQWLAKLAAAECPADAEVQALCALIELQRSCERARFDAGGAWLSAEEQDPERWDLDRIERARAQIAALRPSPPGPLYLRAAIAAEQLGALAVSAPVDWGLILDHYRSLYRLQPQDSVALGAAIALARCEGSRAGLAALEQLSARDDFRPAPSWSIAQAHMLIELGQVEPAREALQAAARSAQLGSGRRLAIERQIAQLQRRGSASVRFDDAVDAGAAQPAAGRVAVVGVGKGAEFDPV